MKLTIFAVMAPICCIALSSAAEETSWLEANWPTTGTGYLCLIALVMGVVAHVKIFRDSRNNKEQRITVVASWVIGLIFGGLIGHSVNATIFGALFVFAALLMFSGFLYGAYWAWKILQEIVKNNDYGNYDG